MTNGDECRQKVTNPNGLPQWITLWIAEVVHALTVAPYGVIHALTVAPLRINGRTTNKNLYLSFITKPITKSGTSVDNSLSYPHQHRTCHQR